MIILQIKVKVHCSCCLHATWLIAIWIQVFHFVRHFMKIAVYKIHLLKCIRWEANALCIQWLWQLFIIIQGVNEERDGANIMYKWEDSHYMCSRVVSVCVPVCVHLVLCLWEKNRERIMLRSRCVYLGKMFVCGSCDVMGYKWCILAYVRCKGGFCFYIYMCVSDTATTTTTTSTSTTSTAGN